MQTFEQIWADERLIELLKDGGVAVMPTDTIYGMVGQAEKRDTVERIYKIRNRDQHKPCIIIIGDINELSKFKINFSSEQKNALQKFWPGPVSVVLECSQEEFTYLHRGTRSLAFRLPAQAGLRELLLKTGPLIAPSANTEKFPASESIEDAKNYFGDKVDMYVDGGEIVSKASKVIKLNQDGSVVVLRE